MTQHHAAEAHPAEPHIRALRALPPDQQRLALEGLVDLIPFQVLWHAVVSYLQANKSVQDVLVQQTAEAALTLLVRAIEKSQSPILTYIQAHADAQQAIAQQLREIIQTLIATAIDDAVAHSTPA